MLSPLFLDCTFRNGLQRQAALPGKPMEQGKEGQWWLPRSSGVRMKDAREGFVPPTLTTWEMVIVLESGIPNIKSCCHVSGQSSERETVATDKVGSLQPSPFELAVSFTCSTTHVSHHL